MRSNLSMRRRPAPAGCVPANDNAIRSDQRFGSLMQGRAGMPITLRRSGGAVVRQERFRIGPRPLMIAALAGLILVALSGAFLIGLAAVGLVAIAVGGVELVRRHVVRGQVVRRSLAPGHSAIRRA